MKKYFTKGLRIFLWIILSLIGLVLVLIIALQIPVVQNYAKDRVVSYLTTKLKTKIVVDRLQVGFPKDVILKGVYFEDMEKDTLLAGRKIQANLNLIGLLHNKVEIYAVELEGIVAHINRNKENKFNFDYIVEAFKSPEKQKDNSAPLEFSIDKVNLDNIRIRYKDVYSNNEMNLDLNHLDTRIKTFDVNQMNFELPQLKVDGMKFGYKQSVKDSTAVAETRKSNRPELKLKFGTMDLAKISIAYLDEDAKIETNASFDKLFMEVKNFDMKTNVIDLDKIEASKGGAMVTVGKKDKDKTKDKKGRSTSWKVNLDDVAFQKVNFIYNDNNYEPTKKGIDYRHLDLQNLNLDANKLAYSEEVTSGTINSMKVIEKSGLHVQALKTNFYYGRKSAYAKNLYLKTPHTELRDEIVVGYPSIESLSKNPGELVINANLKDSHVAIKDLLIIVPQISDINPFRSFPNAVAILDTKISGKLNNLNFPNFQLTGMGKTKVKASGSIVGLPDGGKAYYNLNIKSLQSTAKDAYGFLPPNTIPANIQLPEQFSAKGFFKGTIYNFKTDMILGSNAGNAKVKGYMDRRVKNQEKYNLDAVVDNLNMGRLFKNDSLGKATFQATVKGTGFNPKTANASADVTIVKAEYNHYTYTNVLAKGKIHNSVYDINALTKDPNLTFDLVSSGSFKDKYPQGTVHLNVDIADLDKLNLHAGPLKLRGQFDADVQSANLDYLNGKASINNLVIATEKEQFATDSINVVAVSTATQNSIVLKSKMMDAEFVGKYNLSTLANSVKKSISNYYNLKSTSKNVPYGNQQVAFKVKVKSSPILTKVIPDLEYIEPIAITGRYNSVNDTIILNGAIPKLVYGTNTIANGVIKIDTKDDALIYAISVDEIRDKEFRLHRTSFGGQVKDDVLDYTLLVKDFKDKDRYQISGNLKSVNIGDEIWFDPKKLILNYDSWTIADDNNIRFSSNSIHFKNFEMSKGDSRIKLQSQHTGYNPPLAVQFENFEIRTLTGIVQMETIDMDGIINGNVLFKDLKSKILFTADATIDEFTFRKETVGKITINVDNYTANTYTAKIAITEEDNQVNLDGTYRAIDDALNMNLNIQKLNLKSVQGFSMDNVKEGSGYFTGQFKVSGNTSNPKLIGELKFNEIAFTATKLNAKFKNMNDKMVFTDNGILLDNFTIYDEKNNDLVVNGRIDNQRYTNLGFDLTVDADNFKAVNSSAKDNDTFYGQLYLDNHLRVKGSWNNPFVDGTIRVNEDTRFTVVLPQDDASIADREGIVEFIDQDQPPLFVKLADENLSETEIKGMDASVNIEIDRDAEISLIIDKGNGDFLRLKGEADLTGGIDPSGKTTLIGRYELQEGSYEMSFNLVKRKFDIKEGSYILWTGEPTTADISITAVYKTNAAPIELLNNQLSSLTPEERNTYKQKIPFETELKMRGDLMKPVISFNIILPEGNNNVSAEIIDKTEAKLEQLRREPDDLNKQVFALLLLNRFIGEDPFSSESGTTASSFARESVSKIFSQQLNNLASDLIDGVEVDFDLAASEDYTTGQRENKTDLNVALSKKLLDDRLKVTVGSTFGIEGPEQKNKETNTIGSDLAAEYSVSKDGRYKLRAYRKNLYQVALQGQVIETGLGFIITLDYNKFKELFQSKKKDEKSKKAKKKAND